MPNIGDGRKPNGPGFMPLQHQDYIGGKFSLDYRASVLAVRITGRDEMGSWQYDQDSPGDLVGGNLWLTDQNTRRIPAWAFAWPTVISASGSSSGTATGGGGKRSPSASNAVFPIGGGGGADGRFQPKQPLMPFRDGKAGKDPLGAAKAAAAAAAAAAQGGGGNILRLGIGAQVVPFSGGGFPQFSGVRQNFTGFGFAQFEGVRTNYGGSSFPGFSGVKNFLKPNQQNFKK